MRLGDRKREESPEIRARQDEYDAIGYRYVARGERVPAVGDELEPSRVWVEDEPTDQLLPGTCAFCSREACEAYADGARGYILTIGGEQMGTDEDYEDGILISGWGSGAVVLAVDEWPQVAREEGRE